MAKTVDETTLERQPTMEPPVVQRGPSAYLLVIAGPSFGEMHRLQGSRSVIGRADTAAVRVLDDGISREHAVVERDGGKIVLLDLGSTNGTFCNGTKVKRQELVDGDKISVGGVDDPEVHLPGPGRRAVPEAAVRVGAARRADRHVQPALLRRPSEQRDAVRLPARQVAGAAVRRHRSLQEDQRRVRAPGGGSGAGGGGARDDGRHPLRGRAGPVRRRGVRHHLPGDREGGGAGAGGAAAGPGSRAATTSTKGGSSRSPSASAAPWCTSPRKPSR